MKKIFIIIIFICLAISAFAIPTGKTIMAFYKSTENQAERDNEIVYFAEKPLQELGLTVKYWDVDKGLPSSRDMTDVRAIITWFRGAAMKNAVKYIEFITNKIDEGFKIIVIDNFGAYQEQVTGDFIAPGVMNAALARLGIWYLGDWTTDSSIMKIYSKDSDMVEANGKQDVNYSKFFYRFLQVDRDVSVHLSIQRTDKKYEPSPVIVTNRNGGFALSRYVYHSIDNKVTMLLNLPRFLKESLFETRGREQVGLIVDTSTATLKNIAFYTEGVLKRAKIPVEIIYKERIPGLLSGDLNKYTAIGLILKDDAGLTVALLNNYLSEGGGIVCLYPGNFDKIQSSLALTKQVIEGNDAGEGVKIKEGFMTNDGLSINQPEAGWEPGPYMPAGNADILGTDSSGKTPLFWTFSRGLGRGIVWNWSELALGENEGYILESFLYVRPVGVSVTAGLGIMFIDDWPLPMYNNIIPPLKVSTTEFYMKQWWPDMKSFFKQYRIPYTAFLVFNYNDDISTPFSEGEFYMAEDNASIIVAREILESGGELGFHGYNHVSPTTEKTNQNHKAWPSLTSIEQAWTVAKKTWIRLFGEYSLPLAYVAPHNIISDDAVGVLKKVFPSMKVVSALRFNADDETVHNFGPHPNLDLYFIPRQTSGYHYTGNIEQAIVSSISGAGIWAHFLHADDLFDPHRALGKSWSQLKSDFHKMINFVKKHYPWLKYVSVREAYEELRSIDDTGIEYIWDENKNTLHVRSTKPGLLLKIRANMGTLTELDGAKREYKYSKMPVYIIRTTKTEHSFVFRK